MQLPAPLTRERPDARAAVTQRLVDLGCEVRPQLPGARGGQCADRQAARGQHHVHRLQPAVVRLYHDLALGRHRDPDGPEVDQVGRRLLGVEVVLVVGPVHRDVVHDAAAVARPPLHHTGADLRSIRSVGFRQPPVTSLRSQA